MSQDENHIFMEGKIGMNQVQCTDLIHKEQPSKFSQPLITTGFLGLEDDAPPIEATPLYSIHQTLQKTSNLPWMLPWTILLVLSGPIL